MEKEVGGTIIQSRGVEVSKSSVHKWYKYRINMVVNDNFFRIKTIINSINMFL